jgi:putative transcriptional regulator
MSRIMTDLRDAVASIKDHHAGKITLRTTTVPQAKPLVITAARVRRIRDHLKMSQEVFARCLHTSRRTLEKWEQGQAKPTGTAAALLTLVERHPSVVQELAAI